MPFYFYTIKQLYSNYTPQDHKVWSILYNGQMDVLSSRASEAYLKGIEQSGFEPDKIPNYARENELLNALTGWQIYEVPGLVADDEFFALMAEKKFPATTWIRKMEQLDYLEEPDMFHDIFGHVPLLTNRHFVDFLQKISIIATKHIDNPRAVELMSRIYWFTIEFGLIKENGENKIYGAGILSSSGESVYCLESDVPERFEYNVRQILDSPFIKTHFQVKYFVIESYEQLYNSLSEIETVLNEYLSEANA